MKYIEAFNNSAKRAIKLGLTDELISAIESYKKKFNYKDYYITLDNLGFSLGVEFIVQPVVDNISLETVAWAPSIKYHNGNPITGQYSISEFAHYKSMTKAYAVMAKEHLYVLMTINHIYDWLKLDNKAG